MADGPIARLRLLARHRDDRANLLGRVRRPRSGAPRVDQPLGHRHPIGRRPPPLAPTANRLWPHVEFLGTLAYTHPVCRKQHDAGTKGQLLWRRMGSYRLFQHFALFGRNAHRLSGQQGHDNLPSQLWIRYATTRALWSLASGESKRPTPLVSSHLPEGWSREIRSPELVDRWRSTQGTAIRLPRLRLQTNRCR